MMSIQGIKGQPYFDLSQYVDLESYDKLHSEICRGFAIADHLSIKGSQESFPGSINPEGQGIKFKPLYSAAEELSLLDDSNPIKKNSEGLDYNQLTTYLKFCLNGNDNYSRFVLFENCKEEIILPEVASYFPNVIEWIKQLKTIGIFDRIFGASFFLLDSSGIPLEHCDPAKSDQELKHIPEFIHIKKNLKRPFYLVDSKTRDKIYINTRVAWWNERDWHGGEPVAEPTYTFRVDGSFSEDFRKKIFNDRQL